MQCIAEVSGTEYMDENSASELSDAIEIAAPSEPLEPGELDPQP